MEIFEVTKKNDVIIYNDPTRDVYGYVFNREDFSSFKEVVEGELVGVYILHSRETGELYIGEGQFKNRISSHIDKKDFWDRAMVFNSTVPGKFHKSYVEFFESAFIDKATLNGIITTNNQGGKTGLSDTKSNIYFRIMEEMIEMSTMSDIFTNRKQFEVTSKKNGVKREPSNETHFNPIDGTYSYSDEDKGISGSIEVSDGVYTLKAGAVCANFCQPYITGSSIALKEQYMVDNGQSTFILNEDIEFTSPATAAIFLTGYSKDGKKFWINDLSGLTIAKILENN